MFLVAALVMIVLHTTALYSACAHQSLSPRKIFLQALEHGNLEEANNIIVEKNYTTLPAVAWKKALRLRRNSVSALEFLSHSRCSKKIKGKKKLLDFAVRSNNLPILQKGFELGLFTKKDLKRKTYSHIAYKTDSKNIAAYLKTILHKHTHKVSVRGTLPRKTNSR